MTSIELYLKNLTAKDEILAQEAACYLINSADINLYKELVSKTDFLYDFVRDNVLRRIEKAVSVKNFQNIIKFFNVYSCYYDDLFASILARYANEDLTDNMYDLLENGTLEQKTYSAKYFSYIPDTVAIELLQNAAFSDDEFLSYNAAEALGRMGDNDSFNTALEKLKSQDDFEQLKSVKFFVAYGKNYPLKEIFKTMIKSKMPENIAGQIPYMISMCDLLKSDDFYNSLLVIDNILSGFGEILPFSEIFSFELLEILEYLINKNLTDNEYSGKIAEILLKALFKFNMFIDNQEYLFDEEKNTKQEVISVNKLLLSQSKEFWDCQKKYVLNELKSTQDRILEVLPIIAEFKLVEAVDILKDLLNTNSEIVICETISTLKTLNSLNDVNIDNILNKIKNPNIKAFIENLKDNNI